MLMIEQDNRIVPLKTIDFKVGNSFAVLLAEIFKALTFGFSGKFTPAQRDKPHPICSLIRPLFSSS